jgi:hypothetical protein
MDGIWAIYIGQYMDNIHGIITRQHKGTIHAIYVSVLVVYGAINKANMGII